MIQLRDQHQIGIVNNVHRIIRFCATKRKNCELIVLTISLRSNDLNSPNRNTLGFRECENHREKLARQASSRASKRSVSQAKKDNRRVTGITDEARIGGINHLAMPPTGLSKLRPQIQSLMAHIS